MTTVQIETVVPALRKLAEKEDGRKRKALEELAEKVEAALNEAEHTRETSQQYGDMSMRQRNALHELILNYAKEINDIEFRNRMKRDAERVLKYPETLGG